MCGITGFTTKNWTAPAERIQEAIATLIHRGPDQQGVFQSNLFSMGATRLKIIDLDSGNQPILSEDGDTGIVFNGEIYNHLELRAQLEKLGHRFTSHSDTETVLHAFMQWDKDCFSRMRGMYAVALWTKSKKRVVLARDPNRLAARARLLPRSISQLALAGSRYWPVADEKISFEYKVKRFLEGSLMPPARAHVYWNGTFSDVEKYSLLKQKLPSSLNKILAELDGLPPSPDDLAPYLWFDQKYFLADDILTKSDRMSMAHSVEVRPPFLDHRIVELAAKLPASLKIRGTQQKFLLKELMKDKLPPEILYRRKIGFDIPAHEWLRGPLRSLLVDALHHGAAECGELFRTDVIDAYLRLHLERKANVGYHLWGLLVLFLWMNK